MELEKINKKLDLLDEAATSQKKAISSILARLTANEEGISVLPESIRAIRKETDRLNNIVQNLGGFDASLAQIRKDLAEKLDQGEKKRQNQLVQQEKQFSEKLNLLQEQINQMERKIAVEIERRFKNYVEGDSALFQQIAEIENRINEQLRSNETAYQEFALTKTDLQRTTNRLSDVQVAISTMQKKQEEIQNKMEIMTEDLRNNANRINELITSDTERNQNQSAFFEQQKIIQKEQTTLIETWKKQMTDFVEKSSNLLNETNKMKTTLDQSQQQFSVINTRFERRINELTELQRLFEEKFSKDYENFKSEVEKRWSNYSLIYGDKQEDYVKQMDDLKNRVVDAEDATHALQHAMLVMSSEIQNGMQALMKMVNGWLDAFDQIRK